MTIQNGKWQTESTQPYTKSELKSSVATIVLIIPVSIGISYFFNYLYDRTNSTDESLLLNSCIYAAGYILLISPIMGYLRTYNFWSILMLFSECFGLTLILVTCKRHLSDQYDSIAGDDPTALVAFISYVSAAVLEESLKLIVFATPLVIFKRFRTVYEAVWFGCLSSVSFATIENLILSNRSVLVALQRFLWCTATHTSDSLVGVLFFLYMKSADHPIVPDRWYLYPFILIMPVALHGTFDFLIFYARVAQEDWIARLSILIGVLSLILCAGMFYPLRRRSPPIMPPIVLEEVHSCPNI